MQTIVDGRVGINLNEVSLHLVLNELTDDDEGKHQI